MFTGIITDVGRVIALNKTGSENTRKMTTENDLNLKIICVITECDLTRLAAMHFLIPWCYGN